MIIPAAAVLAFGGENRLSFLFLLQGGTPVATK